MKAIRSRGLKAASVAVLGSITLAAGLAASVAVASNQSSTKAAVSAVSNANPTAGLPAASVAKALASIRQQKAPGCTTATAPHGAWQHLGGNPALLGGAWTKGAFQAFINSARGKTYLNLALDYNAAQVAQVVRMVREDNFEKSTVNYCDLFPREAFGRNGPTLTKNVTFLDSTYRYHGAPAWKVKIVLGSRLVNVSNSGDTISKRYALDVMVLTAPMKCVNVAPNFYTVYIVVKTHKQTKTTKPKPGQVRIVIRKQAFSAATEEQLIYPTPTGVFRFKVQCGLKGKPRYIVYQSDPQPAGTCPSTVARVLVWELSTLGPDKWQFLSPVYQTFKLKGKKVILAVYKDKQVKVVTTTPTPTTPTTPTTPPTTTTTPKSNVDLCINIDGVQTAPPPGYQKNPPDQNVPGNCTPIPTTTTTPTTTTAAPKSNTDYCTNNDLFPGVQTAPPVGAHQNSDGTCSWDSTTTTATTTTTPSAGATDLCINVDGNQSQSDVDAHYIKDPPDTGVPGNCTPK